MVDCTRKLALWNTRTFKPVITHDELEPVMVSLGFVPLPWLSPGGSSGSCTVSAAWRQYKYSAESCWSKSPVLPRPCLPYPRIDGLHVDTYDAFLSAVNFYLRRSNLSDLLHVRGMQLHGVHDRMYRWQRIVEDGSNKCESKVEDGGHYVFVYREGTLLTDKTTYALVENNNKNNNNDNDSNDTSNCNKVCNSIFFKKDRHSSSARMVHLKDVIVNHNLLNIH